MNYSFLLTLGALLPISAPFLLYAAYREGVRRRSKRK